MARYMLPSMAQAITNIEAQSRAAVLLCPDDNALVVWAPTAAATDTALRSMQELGGLRVQEAMPWRAGAGAGAGRPAGAGGAPLPAGGAQEGGGESGEGASAPAGAPAPARGGDLRAQFRDVFRDAVGDAPERRERRGVAPERKESGDAPERRERGLEKAEASGGGRDRGGGRQRAAGAPQGEGDAAAAPVPPWKAAADAKLESMVLRSARRDEPPREGSRGPRSSRRAGGGGGEDAPGVAAEGGGPLRRPQGRGR